MAWFRHHFNEDYPILYKRRDQAQADAEVEFTMSELGVRSGEMVLDLCCGFGRHLRAFARRGVAAVGVDLSPVLLQQASRGNRTELVCADMRRLPFVGGERGFAVVVNFFTSFGYFEGEENAAAAREVARVLRPGGRFLLDLMNPEPTLRSLNPRSARNAGPYEIVEERRFDAARRRIEKSIYLCDRRSGEERRYFESVQLYNPEEIRELLFGVGLEISELFGDFTGAPASPDAERLIVTGQKR